MRRLTPANGINIIIGKRAKSVQQCAAKFGPNRRMVSSRRGQEVLASLPLAVVPAGY